MEATAIVRTIVILLRRGVSGNVSYGSVGLSVKGFLTGEGGPNLPTLGGTPTTLGLPLTRLSHGSSPYDVA